MNERTRRELEREVFEEGMASLAPDAPLHGMVRKFQTLAWCASLPEGTVCRVLGYPSDAAALHTVRYILRGLGWTHADGAWRADDVPLLELEPNDPPLAHRARRTRLKLRTLADNRLWARAISRKKLKRMLKKSGGSLKSYLQAEGWTHGADGWYPPARPRPEAKFLIPWRPRAGKIVDVAPWTARVPDTGAEYVLNALMQEMGLTQRAAAALRADVQAYVQARGDYEVAS